MVRAKWDGSLSHDGGIQDPVEVASLAVNWSQEKKSQRKNFLPSFFGFFYSYEVPGDDRI
jgi:hypothetical protein